MGASALYPLFLAVAILCYLAAVLIAFPLGAVFELMNEDLSLIPLSIGAVAISLGMIAETRSG